MDSTVRSRPNHYETLGLTPKATSEDIARAFAREVSPLRPRPFGGVAHVSIAYETLRDPVKRHAYDAALGLNQEPQPRPTFSGWRIGAHFMETASVGPQARPERDEGPPPAPVAMPPPAPEPALVAAPVLAEESFVAEVAPAPRPSVQPVPDLPDEPRLPSFLAAALRAPASSTVHDIPQFAGKPAPQPPKPDLGDLLAQPRARIDTADLEVDDAPIEWQRSALAAGGVVLAVAFLAAVAGWSSGLTEVPEEAAEPAATAALPAAKSTSPDSVAELPVEARGVVDARTQRPSRAALAAARTEPAPQPPLAAPDAQPAEAAPGRSLELIAEQTIAQMPPAAPATVQASLPLPNAVVARTIGRIGYSCGQVASTTPVGGSGAFKVTCTSGQSYRAAPVRGRYRFSRWP